MTGTSLQDVIGQLFLLAALMAGISLLVVLLKASKREQYMGGGRFDPGLFGKELLATFGKGVAWVLLIYVCLMGSSLVLRTLL